MGIKIPDAIGIDTLRTAVPRAMAAKASRDSRRAMGLGVAGGAKASLDFGGPHRVYVASVEDAVNRETLQNARPAGWRYFVLRGEKTIATAQMSEGDDERTSFSHINYGVLAESTAHAIEVAQALPDVKKRDYELGVLEVPALYLVVLWLKSTGSNILIPLEPSPRGLQANRPYTQRELDSAVYTLAQRRIESHRSTAAAKETAGSPPVKPRDIPRRRASMSEDAPPRASKSKKQSAKSSKKPSAKRPISKKSKSKKK